MKKRNNTLKIMLIVFIVISVFLGGFILYDKVFKNNVAIKIAKEKLVAANNFFDEFKSANECSDNLEDDFCYYDTLNNFKKKFYTIYSNSLDISDVYNYNDYNKYVFGVSLKEKDNKVYVFDKCTEGNGGYSLKGDYEVVSFTDDTIIVKYVMTQTDDVLSSHVDYDEEIKLVKENGEWKILKATIIGRCNSSYEIGK